MQDGALPSNQSPGDPGGQQSGILSHALFTPVLPFLFLMFSVESGSLRQLFLATLLPADARDKGTEAP